MNFNNLDAILYAEGVTEGELGQAKLSPFDQTCEFTAEFVPMLPIDAPVIIICKYDKYPLLRICGKAYLSTRNYLRIVDVECTLCDGAENLVETHVTFEAKLVKKIRRFEKLTPCYVSTIGVDSLTLTGCNLNPDGADKHIILRVDYPVFPEPVDLLLKANDKGYRFGESPKLSYCFEEISATNLSYIRRFVRNRENAKLKDLFTKTKR